jgi:peptidoglycan hydrolase-like protein with peptidoglycan-binding domain
VARSVDPARPTFDASAVDVARPPASGRKPRPVARPAEPAAKRLPGLLEIQRAAGNAATIELIRGSGGRPVVMRQPVETDEAPAEEAAGPTKRPTLRRGSTGDDVKLLQMKLRNVRERQHDRDAAQRARIDGIFGPLTHEDVVDFQTDTGLSADGIAGPKTWDALDSIVPETPIESEELAADNRFFAAMDLKNARQYDDAIAELEAMISEVTSPERVSILASNIGHCHQQRGRFGFAVERYEQSLSARFNQEELRKTTLDRLSLARQNQFAPSPAPDPEPAVPGADGQPPQGREGGGLTVREEVKAGDAGDAVDLYKGKLADAMIGWSPELGPGNGFDAATDTRTKLFQQAVGLPPTGVADAVTWHALDSFAKEDVPFSTVSPILARNRVAFELSHTDPKAALPQLEGGRDEAKALGLDEIVKNTEAIIGRSHHQLGAFDEAISHYEIYLTRIIPAPPHYGFFLELLRKAHAREPFSI